MWYSHVELRNEWKHKTKIVLPFRHIIKTSSFFNFFYLSISLFITCLSISLFIIYLPYLSSIHLSPLFIIYLSIYLSIYRSFYLLIYHLSIYLSPLAQGSLELVTAKDDSELPVLLPQSADFTGLKLSSPTHGRFLSKCICT